MVSCNVDASVPNLCPSINNFVPYTNTLDAQFVFIHEVAKKYLLCNFMLCICLLVLCDLQCCLCWHMLSNARKCSKSISRKHSV